MSKVNLVTIIESKVEEKDFIRKELENLIPITRKEAGCINYNFFLDNKNSARFIFEESWEDKNKLQGHMESDHLKKYKVASEGKLKSSEIIELIQLD